MNVRAFAFAAFVPAVVACSPPAPPVQHYVDITYPVARRAGSPLAYPHAVDVSGALWYLDGKRLVRATQPQRQRSMRDPALRGGIVFWYDGAVNVLHSGGRRITRIGARFHESDRMVPADIAPLEGVIADAAHRSMVAAVPARHEIAVADGWRWFAIRLPTGIRAGSGVLAGGPHRKRFLVAGDVSRPLVAILNRANGSVGLLDLPDNMCFASTVVPLREPVGVKGRDSDRVWVTSGSHVLSIEMPTRTILRQWTVPGCATQIVMAAPEAAWVMTAAATGDGYRSSVVRVDPQGVTEIPGYGTIDALAPPASIDGFGRLWWFDATAHAFIARTPLR